MQLGADGDVLQGQLEGNEGRAAEGAGGHRVAGPLVGREPRQGVAAAGIVAEAAADVVGAIAG